MPLGLHVLLVERLVRVPVQVQFRRHILDRRRPTATADIIGKGNRCDLRGEFLSMLQADPKPTPIETFLSGHLAAVAFVMGPRRWP
jgi:hypothetical protein